MEPKPKSALRVFRTLFIILQVLVVIILVVALIITSSLLMNLSKSNQDYQKEIIVLKDQIQKFRDDVYYNSLKIDQFYYDITDINAEDQTATVKYYVRLKDSDGVDKITLTLPYGGDVTLTQNNFPRTFCGTTTLDIFHEKENTPSITFRRDGNENFENIDYSYYRLPEELYNDMVPSYELTSSHYDARSSQVTIKDITIKDFSDFPFYKLKSAQLMVTRRGEVLDSFDVKPILTAGGHEFTFEINKSYEYNGTDVQVHLYTVTENGYHVRQYLLDCVSNGRSISWINNKLYVMNEDDEILYTNDRYAH